jgi:hypothetical protein
VNEPFSLVADTEDALDARARANRHLRGDCCDVMAGGKEIELIASGRHGTTWETPARYGGAGGTQPSGARGVVPTILLP